MICLKPFVFSEDFVYGFEDNKFVAVSVLKFLPKHKLCKLLMSVCKSPNKLLLYDSRKQRIEKIKRKIKAKIKMCDERKFRIGWGEAGGPTGFTRALKYFQLIDLAKPPVDFYPVNCRDWLSIYDATPPPPSSRHQIIAS